MGTVIANARVSDSESSGFACAAFGSCGQVSLAIASCHVAARGRGIGGAVVERSFCAFSPSI